jgi:hypothetical protein
MTLSLEDLIEKSKREEEKVRYEHKVLADFQRSNPWILQTIIDELSDSGKEGVPTFDNALDFREEYLLNDLTKVYRQIKKRNPLLIDEDEPEQVYYYTVKPQLFKKQLKKGYALGDRDENGYLVSGSNLVLEAVSISLSDFLVLYYTLRN